MYSDYNHKLNAIKYDVHVQCHGNYIEAKKSMIIMLESDILRNSFQNILDVLMGDF